MPKYLVTAMATISLQREVVAATEEDALYECEVDWDLELDMVGELQDLEASKVSDD